MQIHLPQSSYPVIRLVIDSPAGMSRVDLPSGSKTHDFDIPEGVSIDQVAVRYEFVHGRQVIAGGVLKYASETPEPPAPIVPVVDIPDEPIASDAGCDCGEKEACSNCDPEDEIAEPDDESEDESDDESEDE